LIADYVGVLSLDPSIITGAVTVAGLIVKGIFEDRANKRRYGMLSAKIDENTEENRAQIVVSNHVNEKIATTNEVAADGLMQLRGEVGELKQHVQELATAVRATNRRLDAVIVANAPSGD
jgi:chromosomal replication initiation ATPase DnaA